MGGFFTRTELLTWVASVPAGKAQSGSSLSSQGFRITNLVHVQGVPLLQLVLVLRLQEQAPSVCRHRLQLDYSGNEGGIQSQR